MTKVVTYSLRRYERRFWNNLSYTLSIHVIISSKLRLHLGTTTGRDGISLCHFFKFSRVYEGLVCNCIYFIFPSFIGLQSSPINKTTVWGIPDGIFIFFLIHFWLFLGVFLFKDSLPRKKQPLVPLFFSGLFFFLGYFQELAWLSKWIEGIDLLLLLLGTFSLVEGKESHITEDITEVRRLRRWNWRWRKKMNYEQNVVLG